MFRILIADDEQFIRKGITAILKRGISEEIECVEASNGQEALIKAREQSPNLIITDISMPMCDGLEFIRELRQQDNEIPIVILSGYDNFEYAQQAIRLGVKEYIMKPIKKGEFITLIQDYIDNIKRMKAKSSEEIARRLEHDRIIDRLRHDFLLGLLKCPTSAEAERYLIHLKELGMEFESKLYVCAVVQYKINEGNQDYLDFTVKNILDEYLGFQIENERVVNVSYDMGRIAVIFEGSNQTSLQESKKRLMRKAAVLLKQHCKTEFYIGLGDIAYDSIHLHTSLRHALLAADFKLYEGGDVVMTYDEIPKETLVNIPNLVRQMRPVEDISVFKILEGFQSIIRQGESKSVINLLRKEYEEVQEFIHLHFVKQKFVEEDELKEYTPLSSLWTFGELKREIKERIELLQKVYSKGQNINPQLIHQIIEYVDQNITEEIDLTMIADKFNRTPGYISTLFKRHTQGGFNTYLTQQRIAIAKRLLSDINISVQEVSVLSGFVNSKYFSVVFKKMVGISPREYRNKSAK